ncbi:MAG: tRNA (adenosine(37)-N6)-threonylcarbamoyltransferase complex dimerization subunit type 1 TsaB [Cyclonatronaceae bacterium]
MNLLAIETATDFCSVAALTSEGIQVDFLIAGKGVHSEGVFAGIKEVLTKTGITASEIDAVLLSGGPGSYTGLRVGYSAVKGFLFGHSARLYIINTLLSVAAGVTQEITGQKDIHIVLNARRQHLIHQAFRYENDLLVKTSESEIILIEEFQKKMVPGQILAGYGIERLDSASLQGFTVVRNMPLKAEYLFRIWQMQEQNPGVALIEETDASIAEPAYLTPGF